MTTRTLPTDKHGNVYYGPRTCAEADALIATMIDQGSTPRAAASRVADMVGDAGFAGVRRHIVRGYQLISERS